MSDPIPHAQEPTVLRSSDAPLSSRERFTPGTLLADRFRIIAPLGKGGMGEVYRADDVRLGQPVALKFLPPSLEADRERLQRLYGEVRVGRQVSHPNVCRLYDIAEFEGLHFIAMEYIDGEDLGSLLRRIGKLPHEKALDLTRDICAGLAAAHSAGIVHRDLKPANIMIDGRGRARITDFGLAALEEDLQGGVEIAGTPGYMAPEQAAGQPATQRSDLFSLGLIVYEMFTGMRAVEVKSKERTQSQSTISQHTRDLDPAIQRVILRCLEREPESRPGSIHAVIAALPGGDPLQAAIDAGETPSPEMIAAAGTTGELPVRIAVPVLLVAAVLLFLAIGLLDRVRPTGVSEIARSEVMLERARQLAAQFGYDEPPADVAYFYVSNASTLSKWLRAGNKPVFPEIARIVPTTVRLMYRASPRELLPRNRGKSVTSDDPPFIVPGELRMILDAHGRMIHFATVPPAKEPPPASRSPFDWTPALQAAGFDPGKLRTVTPEWSVRVDTDERGGWEGTYPGQPDLKMRIEAASYHGRLVHLNVFTPWAAPPQGRIPKPPLIVTVSNVVFQVLLVVAMVAALILARRSLRRGRADRTGALRVSLFTFICWLAASLLLWAEHSLSVATELRSVVLPVVADALLPAAMIWLFYIALEPYLRRRWPLALISWTRLLAGRISDPLVGRDILIAVVAGTLLACLGVVYPLLVELPWSPTPRTLEGPLPLIGMIADQAAVWTRNALGFCMVLLLAHVVLRRRAAAIGATALIVALSIPTAGINLPVDLVWRAVIAVTIVALFVRFGLLTTAIALTVTGTLVVTGATLDTSRWFFANGLLVMAAILALAGYGFYRSLGAAPLFSGAVLDD